ncbi:MAG TPA: SDR family NAD(P)-dependent oxidoreductase [Actinomycetota bacterium]|nr:SDR family NAD(P)-dependent oxidoreductase [Actinomycetota bacterium]
MNERNQRPVAVVTGASSGIGAATATRLARDGFEVILGARRVDKLSEIAGPIGAVAHSLDVRDASSIDAFVSEVGTVNVLINNAGLALGLEPIAEIQDEALQTMWETNVLGLIRMTRALLPKLEASGNGHIVNLGSTASFETYIGGGGYTASKHAVRAITRTLRLELLGKPIRVTLVAPGLVETEFSLVRFGDDAEKAARPYEGIDPLIAEDIADCIAWAVTRPVHVNVDEIVVRPRAQATSTVVARNS